jgi:ferritin-like metal-binding protein YciE
MAASTIEEQLSKYLTDAHGIERQALPQMRMAPSMAGDEQLAEAFREHLHETEEQERLVRERLEAHGESPSRVKDAGMAAGGVGFALFARFNPDTPGKLTAHALSYEHLELASYELLLLVADRACDPETVAVATRIRDQERAMAERLEASLDRAVEASLRAVEPADLDGQLTKYLTDAHAIERQAVQLLERATTVIEDPALAAPYAEHLEETREHQRLIEERLSAHGASPSRIKDAAMRLGALNWAGFFQAQSDTPGKLAAFAYAFEHLEVGGYELLRQVAHRAGDQQTVGVVDRILAQERAAAAKLADSFDVALDASLRAQGVAASPSGPE